MSERKQIGVIGLGVMGQRMLARLEEHARASAPVAWDPDAAMIHGRAHTLPSFAEALAVQETIEAILRGR